MKKNTVLAFTLSALVFAGWMYFQQKYFPKQYGNNTATSKSKTAQEVVNDNSFQNEFVSAEIYELDDSAEKKQITEQTYLIETDLVRAVFTNKGGDLISYKLKEHASAGGIERVEMIENNFDHNRTLSVNFGTAIEKPIDIILNVKEENLENGVKRIGFYRDFALKNQDGSTSIITFAKRYTFLPNDYMFTLDIHIENKENSEAALFDGTAYTLRTAPQIGPEWDVVNDRYEYRAFSYFTGGKKKEDRKVSAGKTRLVTDDCLWAGVSGKYFAFLVIPQNVVQSMLFSGYKAEEYTQQNSQLFIYRKPISGKSISDQYRIYIGPSSEKILNKYNSQESNPYNYSNLRLEAISASSGMLRPLETLFKWIMEFLYKLIPNWGVAVILLTILTRAVFFPLTKKSSEATRRMQELQPQIAEIQTKYKNNPQRMNMEMAKFYREAGYNPVSGCLPMLIQLPVWFAMFRLFNNYFEFRGASFIPGWIPDLSLGDSILKFGFSIPILKWTDLRLLPIIYVISQLLYGKLTQTPGQTQQNPSMQMMLYVMPLVFFFIFYNAPSGLLLFWIVSNVLMLLQQVIINKLMISGEKK